MQSKTVLKIKAHHVKKAVVGATILAALSGIGAVANKQAYVPPVIDAAPITVTAPLDALASHVGPDTLYPTPSITPGKADTLSLSDLIATYTDSCPSGKSSCTYSQDHRNVPAAEHTQVYDEYNVPQAERNIQNGEVDHFYPLCAGGSNDTSNLWYMPALNMWNGINYGYHQKDVLESFMCVQIKVGNITPQDAYSCIVNDWVACYIKYNLGNQPASAAATQ